MFEGKQNTIVFNEEELDSDFRAFLSTVLATDECFNILSREVELKPLDSEILAETYFPCVTLGIIDRGIDTQTSDNMQIQNRTRFVTDINIYVSGENRRANARKLAKIISQQMQIKFGLAFDQNTEVTAEIDSITRRQILSTNVIDNTSKIIYNY